MDEARPIPTRPLFQAPGQSVPEPAAARETSTTDELERVDDRCELPGCDAPVPHLPGNEGRVRYCCREHRREARSQRRRARYGDAE